ncbi:hypothetical protein Desac_1290 [Desulfobacca acetoxidans DSM 11109]|uniref:Uncharacterized protein n=1 Tax=Desulfobacca acetoxidans (strain ATCC 700848 / DSM 11109 / ASRB2) TaxID=880072 RepID=F2NCL3_DESAR|nr:hypothetical protein Desac_1290 [Desulfobacca acetoxidans DSM 11109]
MGSAQSARPCPLTFFCPSQRREALRFSTLRVIFFRILKIDHAVIPDNPETFKCFY